MKKSIFYLLSLTLISSCGERAADEPAERLPEPEAALHQATDILFHVRAVGDNMEDIEFMPNEYSVPAATLIRVRLVNESTEENMFHNIVVIKMGTGEEVAREAIEAGPDLNYVPRNPNVITSSELVGPGGITEFNFSTPVAGSYHYICTYPGHFPQMIGRLSVVETIP
ncbi:MAG: hypothetical protein H0X62_16340 [Bacteroidetes bacterium]|nr:hypothetical protein [Bacteroidota bacterium]